MLRPYREGPDDGRILEMPGSSGHHHGAMTTTLHGKWVWIWNWRRCDGGDPDRVAARLQAAGCRGALIKAYDGPHWFDQSAPWREIARALKARGLAAGAWGYHYGADVPGEAQRAIETVHYGQADLLVLDVESEFKERPQAADDLCRRIRTAVGPGYPLYFSSFAIARFHRSFPFEAFRRHSSGAAPQLYWNAFRWPLEQALAWMYEDYAALGISPEAVFPVAGLYQEGSVPYPSPDDVREFVRRSTSEGSGGVSFWSYEHMDEAMWQAVAGAAPEEETEMSSQEYQDVSQRLSGLTARIDRLEAEMAAVRPPPGPPPAPQPRTYTVKPGDTLSGIAAALGLTGWQTLYEANREVIGGDPNLIFPGQVLVIPA